MAKKKARKAAVVHHHGEPSSPVVRIGIAVIVISAMVLMFYVGQQYAYVMQ